MWSENNIYYVNAPGCNSIAVAEYVLSGLFVIANEYQIDLRKTKVAIIGAGNVGTAVSQRLEVMGIPYGLYDPPLQERGDSRQMMSEDELENCEFMSLHVPLTKSEDSQWPTDEMVNDAFFARMKNLRYLINTSRGNVVSTQSLKDWLEQSPNHQCIIDVWQNEQAWND